ncbi:hypothetical protein O9993_04015 [Vibrio lentus]|nr:hypothetical protein [Vibrio lentus]
MNLLICSYIFSHLDYSHPASAFALIRSAKQYPETPPTMFPKAKPINNPSTPLADLAAYPGKGARVKTKQPHEAPLKGFEWLMHRIHGTNQHHYNTLESIAKRDN